MSDGAPSANQAAEREREILRLAVARGLVSPRDVELVDLLAQRGPLVSGPWGPRVERLRRSGLLSEQSITLLVAELEAPGGPATISFGADYLGGSAAPPQPPTAPAVPAGAPRPAPVAPVSSASAIAGRRLPNLGDRYELQQLLGQGGMGAVYRAYDHQLRRPVAIKLIRGESPDDVERFLREAWSQARVEHRNVCKVYEVGESEGRPYIAMQLVAGRTLDALGPELSREDRLEMVRRVAEGLEAAHRLGLVHRDIKPSNVMLEPDGSGGFHPYLMDFGLAREHAAEGLTQTGFALGTPAYMSPEQARGDASLDGRSDVYSLGATLYHLACGRPPFEGANPIDLIRKAAFEEPRPPRAHDPQLSPDAETIILKCLEKDPARRYASAGELAADLRRLLAGDPILARAPTLGYRLVKRVRKHRTIAAVSTVAALVVIGAGIWAVLQHRRTVERDRYASLFGQEADFIEETLRRIRTSPLHPVGEELTAVQADLRGLEERVQVGGALAEGPGGHALGRGYLALGDPVTALGHLVRAWTSGYQTPEVAYALGQAHGEVYQVALRQAEQTLAPPQLAERKARLIELYRQPALEYLGKAGRLRVDSPELVRAQLSFYEERYVQAIALAGTAARRVPWLYEARLLEGRSRLERAHLLARRGEREAARRELAAGERALRAAAGIAPSDGATWEELCRLALVALDVARLSRGDVETPFRLAADAAASGLVAEPLRFRLHTSLARAHRFYAQYLQGREADPVPHLRAAAAAARQAVRIAPREPEVLFDFGGVYLQQARFLAALRRDPEQALAEAEKAFGGALALDETLADAHLNLGNVHLERVLWRAKTGGDPLAALAAAEARYRRARELVPGWDLPWFNAGNGALWAARYQRARGQDAAALLRQAADAYAEATRRRPSLADGHRNAGNAHLELARIALERGEDPSMSFAAAEAAYQRGLALDPRFVEARVMLGNLWLERARAERGAGGDPRPRLREAVAIFEQAVAARSDSVLALTREAAARLALARAELAAGGDPEPQLRAAEAASVRGEQLAPQMALGALALAEVGLVRAEVGTARPPPVPGHDGSAVPAVDPVGEPLARARQHLERALRLDRELADGYLLLARLLRFEAERALVRGEPTRPLVERGLAAVAEALARRPGAAEAFALEGALHLVRARASAPGAARRQAASDAARLVNEAVARDRTLAREFDAIALSAAGLAGGAVTPKVPGGALSSAAMAGERARGARP